MKNYSQKSRASVPLMAILFPISHSLLLPKINENNTGMWGTPPGVRSPIQTPFL